MKKTSTRVTKKLKTEDLVAGAWYHVVSEDAQGKPWKGIAMYVRPSGLYFPDDVFEFLCEDGEEGNFDLTEIKKLAKDRDTLQIQMKNVLNLATNQNLHDAAKWLQSNFKFE